MPDNSEILGQHKGYPIVETAIIVNKLGDGLSAAVGISPLVIEANDVAFLAVRVKKTKDRYEYIRDARGDITGVRLVQIFDSTGATFADNKIIGVAVQKMVDKIEKARADAKGQLTLVLGEVEEDPERPSRKNHPDLAQEVDRALGD
jgi:hypothetical protein